MLYLLRILTFMVLISLIQCIKWGETTETGTWGSFLITSLSFTIQNKSYLFGSNEESWFINEFRDNGTIGEEIYNDSFKYPHERIFPLVGHRKLFLYCIVEDNWWSILQIFPINDTQNHKDSGCFESKPTSVLSYNTHGKLYVLILTDNGNQWHIRKLSHNGRLGQDTDKGSWKNGNSCKVGFTYSIDGNQYVYCLNNNKNNRWFINRLLPNGTMGEQTASGRWMRYHIHYTTFELQDKHYFYAQTVENNKRHWLIQELLPDGRMGTEKLQGMWKGSWDMSLAYSIEGRTFLYGLYQSYNYWIVELLS